MPNCLPLSPELRAFLRTFPSEFQEDIRQELALYWIELKASGKADEIGGAQQGAQERRVMSRAFREMAFLVDPLPQRSLRRVYAALKPEAGRWTSKDAGRLAKAYGTREDTIRYVLAVINAGASSLRQSVGELENQADPRAKTPPEDRAESERHLHKIVSSLAERDAEIISRRYLRDEPMTQAETASEIGISQPRVYQIEKRALALLRSSFSLSD